jgi:hypothetical protein
VSKVVRIIIFPSFVWAVTAKLPQVICILSNPVNGRTKNPIAQKRNGVTWLHIASRKGFKKKPLNVPNKYKIISHIKFQPIRQSKGKNPLRSLAGPLDGWSPARGG